ncbi:hypothetical protein NIO33_004010 [Salmonella enterica]|nr:hypothetical protein [Salmonella enterica]
MAIVKLDNLKCDGSDLHHLFARRTVIDRTPRGGVAAWKIKVNTLCFRFFALRYNFVLRCAGVGSKASEKRICQRPVSGCFRYIRAFVLSAKMGESRQGVFIQEWELHAPFDFCTIIFYVGFCFCTGLF